jgi:hypothetical protein
MGRPPRSRPSRQQPYAPVRACHLDNCPPTLCVLTPWNPVMGVCLHPRLPTGNRPDLKAPAAVNAKTWDFSPLEKPIAGRRMHPEAGRYFSYSHNRGCNTGFTGASFFIVEPMRTESLTMMSGFSRKIRLLPGMPSACRSW